MNARLSFLNRTDSPRTIGGNFVCETSHSPVAEKWDFSGFSAVRLGFRNWVALASDEAICSASILMIRTGKYEE